MSQDPSALVIGVALISVVVGGAAISIQGPINSTLNRALHDPLLSASVSFGVGFAALLLCWLASLVVRGYGPAIPDVSGFPWWIWVGGFMGATYVLAVIWSVPKLGVVTIVAAAVLGQLLAALAIDATGAFGLEARAISPTRVLAVVLVMAGLLLSKL